jgi:shikimate 5-dehydrogenase
VAGPGRTGRAAAAAARGQGAPPGWAGRGPRAGAGGAARSVTEPPKSLGPPTVVLVQRTSDNPVGAPELLDKFGIYFSYLSQERFTHHADITSIGVTRMRKQLHELTFI